MNINESSSSIPKGELADQIAGWFRSAGIEQSDIAVDVVDTIVAARKVEEILHKMLALRPNQPQDAAQALEHIGKLHAWFFSEMKYHLEELERAWPEIEERISILVPSEHNR